MREIAKASEPRELVEWRATYQRDLNYGYALVDRDLRTRLRIALVTEQRGLCAYTGRRITEDTSHIEHLNPQAHCSRDEQVAYTNMVACVPAPGQDLPYGARAKGDWPSPDHLTWFVSPLSNLCESRFSFNLLGVIEAADPADRAATETIHRLALHHPALTELRRAAIEGTLQLRQRSPLGLAAARKRLRQLEQDERANGLLQPFCFALKQALQMHIRRIEMQGKNSTTPGP